MNARRKQEIKVQIERWRREALKGQLDDPGYVAKVNASLTAYVAAELLEALNNAEQKVANLTALLSNGEKKT